MEDNSGRIYLGNIYGLHDGYDGSVFSPDGVAKANVASVGGVSCIIEVLKYDKEEKKWKAEKKLSN